MTLYSEKLYIYVCVYYMYTHIYNMYTYMCFCAHIWNHVMNF